MQWHCGCEAASSLIKSMPEPSGRPRSTSAMSGACAETAARPPASVSAERTLMPGKASVNVSPSQHANAGWSSTTSPRFMLPQSPNVSARSEEHTSELQSLMRISYAVFCLKKKKHNITNIQYIHYENHKYYQQAYRQHNT